MNRRAARAPAAMILALAAGAGGTLAAQAAVGDEAYPQKTVTIICPWSAGGGTDRVSRFWADALQQEFGKPFVVVNRTGGAGAVGHFASAHARPDGHTIGMITFELSTMHRMRISKLTYRDYQCLLQMNADPAALIVRADAPWRSLGEWLDEVRSRPGELRMSGTATGGAWDLARAGLLRAADLPVEAVVWVPHPGAAPSLVELLGGHLEAVCCSVPEVAPQLKGGQLRVLAVMSAERLPEFADLPTAREQGVDWVAVGWRGLALPLGTPPRIIKTLETTCLEIADSDKFRAFMAQNGFGVKIRGPDEFTAFLAEQDEQWREVVEAAGYGRGLTGNHDPGPLGLPAALVVFMAAAMVGEWYRKRAAGAAAVEPARDEGRLRAGNVVLLIAALALYVAVIPWLGFVLSTLCFVSLAVRRLGGSLPAALVTAATLVVVVWLLFVGVFRVQLPAGLFELWF